MRARFQARGSIAGLLATLAFVACSTPLGSDDATAGADDFLLRVIPERSSFTRDDDATLRLVNRDDHTVGHGACDPDLEVRTESGWRSESEEPELCIAILYGVAPGRSSDFAVDLARLAPGTYRYRMELLPGTNLPSVTVYSQEFRVEP